MDSRSAGSDDGIDVADPGYRNLRVWEKSFELAVAIFKIADRIPMGLGITLNAQMRIAALSIPSYIARGQARAAGREFLRALYLAQGALTELETHMFLASELGYATPLDLERIGAQIDEVRRMTAVVIRRMKAAGGGPAAPPMSARPARNTAGGRPAGGGA